VHPSPVINIRMCKIMKGWTGSDPVSMNFAAALETAATTCESKTNKEGPYLSIKEEIFVFTVIGDTNLESFRS
jgi:hypothetical protein